MTMDSVTEYHVHDSAKKLVISADEGTEFPRYDDVEKGGIRSAVHVRCSRGSDAAATDHRAGWKSRLQINPLDE